MPKDDRLTVKVVITWKARDAREIESLLAEVDKALSQLPPHVTWEVK
jgi:hypothetical protein